MGLGRCWQRTGQFLGDLVDDLDQLGIALEVTLTQLFGIETDLRKQALEDAFERNFFDVLDRCRKVFNRSLLCTRANPAMLDHRYLGSMT
jgi:hypothetical protein